MKIEKTCNFIECSEFASKKDATKKFHNAKLLADDIVLDCAFISQKAYDILKNGSQLQQVKCNFDIAVAGTDATGKTVYTVRLIDVIGYIK